MSDAAPLHAPTALTLCIGTRHHQSHRAQRPWRAEMSSRVEDVHFDDEIIRPEKEVPSSTFGPGGQSDD